MATLDKLNAEDLIDISKNAGKAIMDIYHSDFDVNLKKDLSPVTKADLISNEIIVSALRKITPNIPIISEESSETSFKVRSQWKEFWLIDPLDGTKEFIKKNGDFTTNIALIRDNRPVFGIIHVPNRDQTYWGSNQYGCYFLCGNSSDIEEIRVSSNSNSSLRIVCSESHPSNQLASLLKKIENCEVYTAGSSLKFCMIAKGEADCYPRLGLTSEWDTAAGEIIAESAGACTFTIENKLLSYNMNENGFLNPYFIVTNSIRTKEMVLSLI